ncbi:spermatogenesis-associated protein 5 [Agrilus planipennis]|uniref:Spermatogenesis-associated protein 5 n=1 Tax=Agrilus planipennis TaxID=224129 RepID=A0A1W4WU78_AGRPL|nr:spermatogenesis-associated protein 5 [Agrilus planipennis]
MPPKKTQFFECAVCGVIIAQKYREQHETTCPCSPSNISYPFVYKNSLYGNIELKSDKETNNSSINDEFVVFLSQSIIQICGLSIGEWALIEILGKNASPFAKLVWPSSEKSLTSIILTKKGMDIFSGQDSDFVKLSKLNCKADAKEITIIPINNLNIQISPELINRIQNIYLNKLLTVGNTINVLFFGKTIHFKIVHINSFESTIEDEFKKLSIVENTSVFFNVCNKTKWKLFCTEHEFIKETYPKNDLQNVGGLDKEITEVKELLNIALGKSTFIPGLQIIRSIVLYGSPGTGKTLLANALAKDSGAHIVNISMIEIYSKKDNSPEENVNDFYKEAATCFPSVIIIDDIDTLCPAKTSKLNENEKRISASLFKIFEDLWNTQDAQIFVIATTNKLDSIDASLRRSGRLDKEIEIPIPGPTERFEILKKILIDTANISDKELTSITSSAHGFVGSDLKSLCSTAALHAVRMQNPAITLENLKYGLTKTIPSAMREIQIEVPNVKWADIGGQETLKLILKQSVEWPIKHPEIFARMGVTPPKGVLMFGPPGCSKTMIAKALATESSLNFISIKGPELFSKWVGESERAIREVFRKARQVAPAIIFFDEIDAIGGERSSGSTTNVQERVLTQLLTELDGVTPLEDVTVVAATNRPDRIDKALLRPGRLDRIVYVPLPDSHTRLEIFKIKLSKMPVVNVDINELVEKTEVYSGAEINAICNEAAMKALEEDLQTTKIEMKHFLAALKLIIPRTTESLIKTYTSFIKQS